MKNNKISNTWHERIKFFSLFLQNSNPKVPLRKGVDLSSIGLGNWYWKHWPLIEQIFTKHLRLKFLLTVI